MKKIFTILVGLWLVCSGVLARTVEEAAVIASGFMSQKGTTETVTQRVRMAKNAGVVSPQVSLEYTQATTDNKDAVYVFNHTNGGFVWVSASDYSHEVLGYSDSGSFDKDNIPENLQCWLRMYAGEIARAEAIQPVGASAKQVAMSYQEVAPLLNDVNWDQGAPYNNQCPTIGGQRSVTGCVATAISQIMYKHKYPTYGTGSYSYTTESGVFASANFDNTFYDWNNMLPSYAGTYTSTQATAVSTLMYHVGVASSMEYGTNVSLAYSAIALAGLIDYFDYDKGMMVFLKDYMMDDARIMNAIATDLQAGLPVYMAGATRNQEGHAFVCDGMKSDGYLHINWGWGGISNGYFALSALDPELQGTGGSSGALAFTENIGVYTRVKPDAGGKVWPMITAENVTRTSADEIGKNDVVSFDFEGIYNQSVYPIQGYMEYYIYSSDGEWLELDRTVERIEWPINQGYDSYTLSARMPSGLSDGDYELGISCRVGTQTASVVVRGKGEARFPFTLSGDKVYFRSAEVEQPSEEPLSCDFEDAAVNGQWRFAQDGQTNYWIIGTGAGDASDGNNALYITNNTYNFTYDGDESSVSWAYVPVSLQVGDDVTFSWKGQVEFGCYDYVRVFLMPQSESPTAGADAPYGAIELTPTALCEQTNSWEKFTATSPVSGRYNLCFMWHNDGSFAGETSIAIDDVQIGAGAPAQTYDYTIRVKKSDTSDMDISNGVWLWWWNTGQDGQWASTTLEDDGWYTATVRSTESAINCLFATYNDWNKYPAQTEDLSNITGDVCLQIGDRKVDNGQYTLNVLSCSSEEPLPCYTLSLNPSNGGYASAYPARDCYYVGTPVEISAHAYEGYEFSHWSTGDTRSQITVTISGDMEITPYFTEVVEEPDCYILLVHAREGGKVDIYPHKECYEEGEEVEIYATAYDGYEFSHWSTGDTRSYITVRMYEDVEITAYFTAPAEPACYTLSVSASGEGVVNVEPEKECYEEGEMVILEAVANEGYVFSRWSDNNTSAIRTLTMDRNYQLQAVFEEKETEFDVKNLTVTNSKLNITAKWESIATRFEVTITDQNDSVVNAEVVEISDEKKVYKYKVSKYAQYTVTVKPLDADDNKIGRAQSQTITLERKYSLYISSGIGGTVNEEVNGDYLFETSVEIIATPKEGYEFFKWSDGNTSAIRTLIMDQDYELVAYFNQKDVAVEDVCADVTVAVEYRTIIVESTQSQDFALYDVVGRLIERQAYTDIANFTVPSAGLYLLRTNNGFVKVRVK